MDGGEHVAILTGVGDGRRAAPQRESSESGALQRLFEIAQPIASPLDVDHVRAMQQPVEDGGGKDLIADSVAFAALCAAGLAAFLLIRLRMPNTAQPETASA